MPRGTATSSVQWFTDLWGFKEGNSYSQNAAKFKMDGDTLVCESSPHPRQHVGKFETPTLAELRSRVPSAAAASSSGLTFENLATPAGVVGLILDPANAGGVFQAASQFNCLEMIGPGISPRQGVARYASDPTQGPKCALACPAGTIYRNYLWEGKGQGDVQINCLDEVEKLIGNVDKEKNDLAVYWHMQNGYALPPSGAPMRKLGERLKADAQLAAACEAALKVGVHWDTQAKPPHTHNVCQVYASAVPVAYSSASAADWETFARLVLRSAYEATLAVGAIQATPDKRVSVYLTFLGGGAFGNRKEWINDAIRDAMKKFAKSPIDVKLLHYGNMVSDEWMKLEHNLQRDPNHLQREKLVLTPSGELIKKG